MKYIQLILLSCFLCLTGCSILSPIPQEADCTYTLDKMPRPIPQSSTRRGTLLVLSPDTKPMYDTQLMAYMIKPYQVSYYSINKWADRPSQMLLPLMVGTLQGTHAFHAVIEPPFSGYSEYILRTQIVELRQNLITVPRSVELVMRAQLIRSASNRIVASKQFSITEPIMRGTPYGGVVAANIATAKLLKQLAVFTLQNT